MVRGEVSRPRARLARRCHAGGSGVVRRNLYLLTGIRGETVTDVSQRLLAQHGGLRGLFRLDVVELALRPRLPSQRPARRGPGWSIAGAPPGWYCEQSLRV